nr:helix-turn-helix domain-containing protein [uncultured Duganella sp.]
MRTTRPTSPGLEFRFELDHAAAFPGQVETRVVGELTLWRLTAPCAGAVRAAAPARAEGEADAFLLALQRRGAGLLEQRGRTLALAEGDMVLCSPERPCRCAFAGPFQQIVARIAAAPMRALCPQVDDLAGEVLDSRQPQVALLAAMADCYPASDYDAQPAQAARLAADALRLALAGCALAAPSAAADPRRSLSLYHLGRIRKFALDRLGDSKLSVAHVVEGLDISSAHIHRLFAGESQSFSAWLWETRLMLCHLALRNPSLANLSIGEIAYKFGYSHAAHFSRAYRLRFGMTPSAWRQG